MLVVITLLSIESYGLWISTVLAGDSTRWKGEEVEGTYVVVLVSVEAYFGGTAASTKSIDRNWYWTAYL